jgi:hypothetical protein
MPERADQAAPSTDLVQLCTTNVLLISPPVLESAALWSRSRALIIET